ncbi:hypothetical protein ACKC9G_05515 [Pokkaliibacter sp. CJK22405]|uniref:hypothetical protein n=1 Tax=Pokkaliibacter sp. CJK22405 TaxID=3384615 RepID=UPI0039853530
MYKLQVQDDDQDARIWHNVTDDGGQLLTFESESAARAELEKRFPVKTGLEQYGAGRKRTRVIAIYDEDDEDDWPS